MSSVRQSLAIAFVERYLLIALSLVSSMLLARLLTPEEIGLYSINLIFIGVAHMLRDFGISNYLVQAPNLSRNDIRTSFGISLLLGGVLCLVLFLAAPAIALFYKDSRLVDTLRICALNFVVLPFNSVPNSLMRRDMQFQRLIKITISAAIIGTATTVGMAFMGAGPNSMAIGAVVTSVVTAIGSYAARADFRGLLPSLVSWRPIANFGGQSALTSVITSISMDMPELVAGKVLGFAPVAILSRAQGLMNMIHRDLLSAVRGVAYPAFARTHRDGGDVEAQHSHAVVNLTVMAWPVYGLLGIHAPDFIYIMFGKQWNSAAPLVPYFCLAGAFAAVGSLVSSQLMAVGRIGLVTRTELIVQPAKAAALSITLLIFQSTTAVAVVFFLSNVAALPIIYGIKAQALPLRIRSFGAGLLRSAACTAAPLAVALIIRACCTDADGRVGFPLLVASSAAAALAWFVCISLFRHPLRDEALYQRLLRVVGLGKHAS